MALPRAFTKRLFKEWLEEKGKAGEPVSEGFDAMSEDGCYDWSALAHYLYEITETTPETDDIYINLGSSDIVMVNGKPKRIWEGSTIFFGDEESPLPQWASAFAEAELEMLTEPNLPIPASVALACLAQAS